MDERAAERMELQRASEGTVPGDLHWGFGWAHQWCRTRGTETSLRDWFPSAFAFWLRAAAYSAGRHELRARLEGSWASKFWRGAA